MQKELQKLGDSLVGELKFDSTHLLTYATDASAYREIPLGVSFPRDTNDIKTIIGFAQKQKIGLIPRTAGTSLAGQVVGSGLIIDVSKHFTEILELNKAENWVTVQPGVIRDELNYFLKTQGFLFGPETSTSNRAMIGGMVGNNSCGSNSVIYGSTRDHLIEVTGLLSDGTEVTFHELTKPELELKLQLQNLEGDLYRHAVQLLSEEAIQNSIQDNYPKKTIHRRNTGYALDMLMDCSVFNQSTNKFNFCKLIAGSEGTLMIATKIKLHINPLPPPKEALIAVHFDTVNEALMANLIGLKYKPYASELMDDHILDCTMGHPMYEKLRFFIQGKPKAILAIHLRSNSENELDSQCTSLIDELKNAKLGHHYPILKGTEISKVWTLRKAGLGLLANIPGDKKAVPVIEDTCVDVQDLPEYISDFNNILKIRNLECVHYAHAGSGELHLRPMINLKTSEGVQMFKQIAQDIAELVKIYKGSLSGEHGDGRLRGEFISYMVGEEIYAHFKTLKKVWDPNNIFNPQKIIDTPEMNTSLRSPIDQPKLEVETGFDFSDYGGFIEASERCNGSADCRKTELTGGVMCPSYMVTRDEIHTTRARANVLREVLTHPEDHGFDSKELENAMELCLMCKGCQTECPSNVDMARYKSEYLFQKHKIQKPSFISRQAAHFSSSMEKLNWFRPFVKPVLNSPLKKLVSKATQISNSREFPFPESQTLEKWYYKEGRKEQNQIVTNKVSKVVFLVDEFTNYLDVKQGKIALRLLWKLGYDTLVTKAIDTGRTAISKGFLDSAKNKISENVAYFSQKEFQELPIIGIEPSTVLVIRDEYIQLQPALKQEISKLKDQTILIDEFITTQFELGLISSNLFTSHKKKIKFHGHCHQKALGSMISIKKMLSIPSNYEVSQIPSGCCGMAGSFGYEHFETSMKIGELVLFPAIRNLETEVLVAASGTSCRQQIKDGLQHEVFHPVEILFNALNE